MKTLLTSKKVLIVLLAAILLVVSPAVADTLKGQVEEQIHQTEVSAKQEDTPVIEVKERGGEVPIGVLGATIDNDTGRILKVYPASALNTYGVRDGDTILKVNGRPFNFRTIRRHCTGRPGQLVNIEVRKAGQIHIYEVPLVDARRLQTHHSYFRQQAEKTRRW